MKLFGQYMNHTNTTISPAWLAFVSRSSTTIAVETGFLLLFGAIAASGNLLVIVCIYRSPSLKTITNVFVFSMSLVNFLIPVMLLPFTLSWCIKGQNFKVNQSMCDFQGTSIICLIYLSVINTGIMAVNRYVRVCKPQKYQRIFNKKTVGLLLASVCVLTFTIATLIVKVLKLTKSKFIPSLMVCLWVYEYRFSVIGILGNMASILCVGIPLIVINVCYYKIFKKIREHKRNVAPSSSGSGLGTSVQEVKITWTLFAVVLSYFLSWIPAIAIQVIGNLAFPGRLPREVQMIVTYNVLCSSAINPFVYAAINPAFRSEYAKIFKLK